MMRTRLRSAWLVAVLCVLPLAGCGEKADENKPIADVKAEAEQLEAGDLRDMAMAYKDAILAKQKDVEGLKDKIKEIPLTEALGEEAKKLKDDVAELGKSLSALTERYKIYYEKLKAKKGDLTGLES